MKKIYYYVIGIVALLAVVVGGTWISASNGAVTKENAIIENMGNVHAKLSGRYEKITAFIDAVEGANATVQGYLDTIMTARAAFADAIAAGNNVGANETAETIDGTFVTLVSYMEDNPASYNTVNLYGGYMAEFAASTNMVTTAITTYNSAVTAYNNHIKTFPNVIFVGGRTTYDIWPLTNYNSTLPTFN